MTLVLFVFILSILIVVHEAGHFLTAKKLGVRVEEFALGFGPKLFSRMKDGTNYCVCAIPLGGYVKMSGDERDKCKGEAGEYFSQPLGHRALIVLMGPVVNYLLAYCCFVAVFMIGFLDVDKAMKALPAKIGNVMAASPAQKAGIRTGDTIIRIDGKAVPNWDEMQTTIMASQGKSLEVVVDRGGAERTIVVRPEMESAKDIFGRAKPVSRIGVQPAGLKEIDQANIERYALPGAMKRAATELWRVTSQTYVALWEIVTGRRSAKEGVTGLIGIFFIIKFALGVGFAFLLHIVGVLSASLAIFNLLPLVPLDGGHLALVGLEKVRQRPLSLKADEIIGKAGFGLIIALAVFVFYVDFERIGLIDRVVHLFIK
jgi:regulator of sigma E protease